jgi:hypothetical protein
VAEFCSLVSVIDRAKENPAVTIACMAITICHEMKKMKKEHDNRALLVQVFFFLRLFVSESKSHRMPNRN